MSSVELHDGLGADLKALEMRYASGLQSPQQWLLDSLGGSRSAAGVSVNPLKALGCAAFFACVRNIAEDMAKIEIELIRYNGNQREILHDHPLSVLLNQSPNPEMTAFDLRNTLYVHRLAYRGGFLHIVRDRSGNPIELWPMDPGRVVIRRSQHGDQNLFQGNAPGEIVYDYHLDVGVARIPADQVLHLKGLSYNGISGWEIAQVAKDTLGMALATQMHVGSFFANGAVSAGILEVPASLSDPALRHLRESFTEKYVGAKNAYRPIILEEGTKFNETTVDPKRAQMIEAMSWHVVNIARLFRMPPHKIQELGRATFSNIESQAREYVGDTLQPHAVNFEQVIGMKLLHPVRDRNVKARHNFHALLRPDVQAQAEWYAKMYGISALNANEIRAFEGLNPIKNGDVYYRPVNLAPVGQGAEPPDAPPPTAIEPPPDNGDDDNEPSETVRAFLPALRSALTRVLRIEAGWARSGNGKDVRALWTANMEPVFFALRAVVKLPTAELTSGLWSDHARRHDDDVRRFPVDELAEVWSETRAEEEAAQIVATITEAMK